MAKKLVSTSSNPPPYSVGDKATVFTYKDKLGNVYPIETKGLQMAPIMVGSTQVLIPKRYKDSGVQIGTCGKSTAKASSPKPKKSSGGSSGGKVVSIPLDRANTYFQKNKGARSKDYLRTTKV